MQTVEKNAVARATRHEVTLKIFFNDWATGVGKTEIARRLAKLANAPFVKWKQPSSPKWAMGKEVGFIIRDLTDSAMKLVRQQEIQRKSCSRRCGGRSYFRCATTTTEKNQWG